MSFNRLLPEGWRRHEPLLKLAPVVIHTGRDEESALPAATDSSLALNGAVQLLGTQLLSLLPTHELRALATGSRGGVDFHVRTMHGQASQAASAPVMVHMPTLSAAPASSAGERAQIIRERASIHQARDRRHGEAMKLLAQGFDGNFLRLNVLRQIDVDIASLQHAPHPDHVLLELKSKSRERLLDEAIESMAQLSAAGNLVPPVRSNSLHARWRSGLGNAVRAREQRHALLKLTLGHEQAKLRLDALDRREQELGRQGRQLDVASHHPQTHE
ncbi:MAG: hypothetical protein H7332_06750 [Bdellovibrionales bacterium]|nr:hypothetical protein [Ramlibacter sp.]